MFAKHNENVIYILYHIGHIGDTFETHKIIENIIKCNPDKKMLFYVPNNFFIYSKISDKLLFKTEENQNLIKEINMSYQHPYNMIAKNNKDIVLIELNMMKFSNNLIPIIEMNPESYQKGIVSYFDKLRINNVIDLNYTVLENKDLIPEIPQTNIDHFLKWKKTVSNPLLFYYNYFPKSGQKLACMSDYDHEQVIIHISKVNPNYIILVPKYTEGIKNNKSVVSCEELFDCKESLSCENLYKQLKIQEYCNYSVVFNIGACMTYMNTNVFSKKNTILHFNDPADDDGSYCRTIVDFLQTVDSVNHIYKIKSKDIHEIIDYFSKNPLLNLFERTQGYGSSFNNLYLLKDTIIKEAKSSYGVSKIQKEILFYNYIQKHKCLPMPNFIKSSDSSYTMTYLPEHKPLFQVFPSFSENKKADILQQINTYLHHLHQVETMIVSRSVYEKALYLEIITKLEKRYIEVKDILNSYAFIKSVNNIPIRSFQENLNLLQQAATKFIESRTNYLFTPIHGDCQFNNILYNSQKEDFVFIDPRGYFGDHDIFGLPEYDFAKVKFALSGYDIFDASEITCLRINGTNITLDIPTLLPQPLAKDDFISQLVVSIWMGNAHCFKENKFKTAYSYFIAMYYASLYL